MNTISIRNKLVVYFLLIALVLLIVDVVFGAAHFFIVNKYEAISANIFHQYQLIEATDAIVEHYNIYRNAPIDRTLAEYNLERTEAIDLLADLQKNITNEDSQITLTGVQNTIQSVINETDAGVSEIAAGTIVNASEHYFEAQRKLEFVRENTASLILKEVEYSNVLQTEVSRTNRALLIFSGILLAIMILASVLISNAGAKEIVVPLTRLTTLAKAIAGGNLEIDTDKDLLLRKDELGSLSQSLDVMIHNLRENLHTLQKTNAEMIEAKKSVDQKNSDLERFNKLMVDRELKMVELKKKIAELEGKNV